MKKALLFVALFLMLSSVCFAEVPGVNYNEYPITANGEPYTSIAPVLNAFDRTYIPLADVANIGKLYLNFVDSKIYVVNLTNYYFYIYEDMDDLYQSVTDSYEDVVYLSIMQDMKLSALVEEKKKDIEYELLVMKNIMKREATIKAYSMFVCTPEEINNIFDKMTKYINSLELICDYADFDIKISTTTLNDLGDDNSKILEDIAAVKKLSETWLSSK